MSSLFGRTRSNFGQASGGLASLTCAGNPEPPVPNDALTRYHARMQRVLDHIETHLDDNLTVEALSSIAAFSAYHFHRQFAELFGISVHRYIQLLRLKRASWRLAFRPAEPVLHVALDTGYESGEAFARAFRARLGHSPSEFRNDPQWREFHAAYRAVHEARSTRMTQTFTGASVRIVSFPETPVAIMRHHGDPMLLGDTIRNFIAWRRAAGLPPRVSATFNIMHNDPETTAPAEYRLDLCAATNHPVLANEHGVVAGHIPAGRCATVRVTGPSENLRAAAMFLYVDWLPRSGEELRDFPMFAQRVSFFPDVGEHEAITDIFVPLR